ncbi:MAG TPA: UxaA family hydrolase [Dehalococcoidia bacterium]|nr:UxaA family hydrolase [Dehalococcoidia bacterium]
MKTKPSAAIVIKDRDNVATAIRELRAGERVMVRVGGEEREVAVQSDIRFLHKFALEDIKRGQNIIKYGQVIGEATRDIQKGEHVHIHNLRSLRGRASD